MTTKRHFEAVAAMIKMRLDNENGCAKRAAEMYGENDNVARNFRANAGGVQLLACDLARLFAKDNPRFDRRRFYAAAGIAHLYTEGSS